MCNYCTNYNSNPSHPSSCCFRSDPASISSKKMPPNLTHLRVVLSPHRTHPRGTATVGRTMVFLGTIEHPGILSRPHIAHGAERCVYAYSQARRRSIRLADLFSEYE